MRLLLLAALAATPFAGLNAASAGPCLPEHYCAPCPYVVVLDPKPHLEHAQC